MLDIANIVIDFRDNAFSAIAIAFFILMGLAIGYGIDGFNVDEIGQMKFYTLLCSISFFGGWVLRWIEKGWISFGNPGR